MRKIFRIFVWVILSVLFLVLLTYLLLWLPPVQQKIKNIALQEVMKMTHGKISIGNIRFRPFNHLRLEDVYVADLKGDTLFYAGTLDAGFNLFRLRNKQILIHSANLTDFTLRLSKDSVNAPFNFRFLVDAFASDTTQTQDDSKMIVEIDKIHLKNGRISYDILSEPISEPGLFDANHIEIIDLQAKLKLKSLDMENLNVSISNFSLRERSGFTLQELEMAVRSQQKIIFLSDFHLALPQSELRLTEVSFDYSGREWSEIPEGAAYSLAFSSEKCYPGDLAYFYPGLTACTDELRFSGEMKGVFPEIMVPRFEMDYGNHLHLQADACLSDCRQWKEAPFELNLKDAYMDEAGIEQLKNLFPGKETTETTGLLTGWEMIAGKGKIAGSLSGLDLHLDVESGYGQVEISGTGGYVFETNAVNFKLNVATPDFNIRNLLSDTLFGKTALFLTTQGSYSPGNKIDAIAHMDIERFDYKGYAYKDINADANCHGDSLIILFNSFDNNLPVSFSAWVNLEKKQPALHLSALLSGVRLDSLHLLPAYPDSELSGKIELDVEGFDLERMDVNLVIDSLDFSIKSGRFSDFPVVISYIAGANHRKRLNIRSKILTVRGEGQFTYDGIAGSFRSAFPTLFPDEQYAPLSGDPLPEEFNFFVAIRQANHISHLLGMETEIPDSALFVGKYSHVDSILSLNTTAFCLFSKTDTSRFDLSLSNIQNNLSLLLKVKNNSEQYDLDGNMSAEIEFVSDLGTAIPAMNITLKPGSLSLNETAFQIYPAQISVRDKRYEINNFALRHSSSEYLKINGVISEDESDSLIININRFQIETLLSALKNRIPLSGMASGDISVYRAMSQPLLVTRNFSIDNIFFDRTPIGDLKLTSGWNSARQGLALRASLVNADSVSSVISGFVLPARDSLALNADIRGIRLKWFAGYLSETLYGMDGEFGARIKANGKISAPDLSGTAWLKDAVVGVKKLNTLYRISDSVLIEPDRMIFNNFSIYDETKRNSTINGTIRHKGFSNLNPNLTVDFNNFLALNNASQTDSLFYGQLQIDGSLNVSLQNKDWFVQGKLKNGKTNKLMVNIPETAVEAERYSWITFINTEGDEREKQFQTQQPEKKTAFSLPLQLHLVFSVDPNLNVGVIFNPSTRDAAQVTGNGDIDFSCNLNNSDMRLQGNYIIEDGKCTLTLKNITQKTFTVRQGGKLNFRGDPMNTSFDLTAVYSLRSDLTTLDPGFADIMHAVKIPVNCVLTASGNMNNMQLKYNVELPNESDDIQRKLNGLLYSDDIKIQEIAYLLLFGSFLPVNANATNQGNSSIWTSLASSSLTSQLNNLLSGVLNDNWTIGTDLHTKDAAFSEIDMDVNVSTHLFNDRLTVSGTLGYRNNPLQNDNFTGDFDFEYKLSPNGNLLLRFYNVTGNQYYEKTKTAPTQGAGIVYRRTGRTFRQLFRSFGAMRNTKNDTLKTKNEK
ncbi:MAG: translocation/assembly module TamB domain-containing protein [Candidatus Symbiothrix sp.]|jgi:hypothetical protein|nr:translocation/assembly module TamB domain-containing protein [Candidatus Symbiothrix sp.]